MENEIQFAFRFFVFMKELKNKLFKKIKINFMFFFHKYGLHVTQEKVRVKSTEVFHCTMVRWIPRICSLENS